MYTTKVTNLKKFYGCRIFYNNKLVLEAKVESRELIGPTFRDLFRTLDKMNHDSFSGAARKRINKPGNSVTKAKHIWPWSTENL